MDKEKRLFLQKDGVKHYKCDSFWSLSTKKEDAKLHKCSGNKIQEHLISNLAYTRSKTDINKYPFYNNCLVGFEDPDTEKTIMTHKIVIKDDKYTLIDYQAEQRKLKLEKILENE